MRKILFVLFVGSLFWSCQKDNSNNRGNTTLGTAHSCGAKDVHNPNKSYGSVTDIDGNTYKTIQIGSQTWMAENLNTTKYRNGVSIQGITDNTEWSNNNTGAYCSYNNNTSNDCPYGKLYNWYAAVNSNGICPTGWRVPDDADWNRLIKFIDQDADTTCSACNQSSTAGGLMKSSDTSYWLSPNTGGTNQSGFSGIGAGSKGATGIFEYKGSFGIWWSFTEVNTYQASLRRLYFQSNSIGREYTDKNYGFSIRCIKN